MSNLQPASLKSALILSQISLVLMIATSLIGLFVPGMYTNGSDWGRATFLGNDLVNLCIFTPLLIIALFLFNWGTDMGRLFWLGMQALITYDFIYYPLGVAYNKFFLLYAATLGVSLYSFLFGIHGMDLTRYNKMVPHRRTRMIAAVLMFVFAAAFAFMWIGRWIIFVISGEEPMEGIAMISTFDLITLMVPMILSAIWLLKGEGRGYVFSVAVTMTCGLYSLILMAYTPFALKLELADAWAMLPLWIFLFVLGTSAAAVLLLGRIVRQS